MSHQVGKKRYIVEPLQKVLGAAMSKGVRVNDRRVQLVLDGELLQLCGNAHRRNTFATTIDEDES